MNRKQLIRKERRELDYTATQFMEKVQRKLGKIRKTQVTLYLKMPDRYRLLKLKVWSKKYCVPVEFILSTLIPFWEGFIQRRSRKIKREGLNVRVATLTGKKSESYLQDVIRKEFSDGANKHLWVAKNRERILANALSKQVDKNLLSPSQTVKNLQDFGTPRQYLRYYRKRVRYLTSSREKIISQLEEYAYRGNPFTPEKV